MVADIPKVAPYLLERADRMCARRLRAEYEGRAKTSSVFSRGRLRDPFILCAEVLHGQMKVPVVEDFFAPAELLPEEHKVFDRFVSTYVELFGSDPARLLSTSESDSDDWRQPLHSKRRNLLIAGWVDLPVITESGRHELRQLEMWGKPLCANPAESFAILCAVLRLARTLAGNELTIRHVDLVTGDIDTCVVNYGTDLDSLRNRFDGRLSVLRSRIENPIVIPGIECGMCAYIAGCPAHSTRVS